MKTHAFVRFILPFGVKRLTLALNLASAALVLLAIFFSGCAEPASGPRESRALGGHFTPKSETAGRASSEVARDESRPGLGTGWGEERDSEVHRTGFVRANGNRPNAVDRIYYNDRAGVDAMLASEGGSRRAGGGLRRMASGLVSVGVRNGSGRYLDGFIVNDSRLIVGERGDRYEIVVHNETGDRIEVVLSVDGLDVMDGRSASFSKRGYIIHAGDTLTVDGFRTSSATVAAFRFSRVDRSYAALKHGDTRNVGVIGIAAFTEREPERWRRHEANPFPGARWATPPE